MDADEEERTLIEEKEEEMVAFLGSKVPIKRKGWFLKPISNSSKNSKFPPPSFTCSHYKTSRLPKCNFKGWVCSLRYWDQWVQKLMPIYKDLWKKVGIFDAINASMFKFGRDPSSLWGVARFWCEDTNTFLFPWAEATITLEDVMILGGFSVIGEPVTVNWPLDGELEELEAAMGREMRKFNQTKSKKADITAWMKHYIDGGDGDELEHTAFLAMWLSRFVLLRHPARTVGYHVIPVAIRLARGARIALAPAVLASIYRDLRKMKNHLANKRMPDTPSLIVWAPMHILQLWIWERFLALRPASSRFVNAGEPRAARWCNVGKKLNYWFVMTVIKSQDEIQWRPYLASLDHWCMPSYFRDVGDWVFSNEVADVGMKSFAQCLRDCELLGLDSAEQYRPHRVARQFGLDQDVPHFVPRANSTWEVAWGTYDMSAKNVKFYVPSRLFESDVTLQYSVWWDGVQRVLRKKMKGNKRKKIRSLQSCNEKEGQDMDDIRLSDWISQKKRCISRKHRCENPHEGSTDLTATQYNDVCMRITEISGEVKSSLESSEVMKQYADTLVDVKLENGAVTCNPYSKDIETLGCIVESIAGESVYDPAVKEEAEENCKKEEADNITATLGCTVESIAGESVYDHIVKEESEENCKKEEADNSTADELTGVELDIEKLKEEIAWIHARVKNLESITEVHH